MHIFVMHVINNGRHDTSNAWYTLENVTLSLDINGSRASGRGKFMGVWAPDGVQEESPWSGGQRDEGDEVSLKLTRD